MTSIFDGVASVIGSVLGAEVICIPRGGLAVSVEGAIFREEPLTLTNAEGFDSLVEAPTLRLSRAVMALAKGDEVRVGARVFRVRNKIGTGSPAADAFVVYELEEITT